MDFKKISRLIYLYERVQVCREISVLPELDCIPNLTWSQSFARYWEALTIFKKCENNTFYAQMNQLTWFWKWKRQWILETRNSRPETWIVTKQADRDWLVYCDWSEVHEWLEFRDSHDHLQLNLVPWLKYTWQLSFVQQLFLHSWLSRNYCHIVSLLFYSHHNKTNKKNFGSKSYDTGILGRINLEPTPSFWHTQ